MTWAKRAAYLLIMTGLTSSAVAACYWQSKRFLQARERWNTIKRQLNLQNPDRLQELDQIQLYPFKYVAVSGNFQASFERVQRMRNGRMGYLVVRALTFSDKNHQRQQIAALEGWCEDKFAYEAKQASQKRQLRGILRQKQKKDYVHSNFKKQDLQRFKMTTYIDLQTVLPKFNIKPTTLSSNYYLEILKPLEDIEGNTFPYQYSVDNFELPYLTPDKHLSYATFWGCTTLVGLFGIFKALKLR